MTTSPQPPHNLSPKMTVKVGDGRVTIDIANEFDFTLTKEDTSKLIVLLQTALKDHRIDDATGQIPDPRLDG